MLTLHKKGEKFPVVQRVRRGDTITPKLFTVRLRIQEAGLGRCYEIRVNREHLGHLRLANDVALFSE